MSIEDQLMHDNDDLLYFGKIFHTPTYSFYLPQYERFLFHSDNIISKTVFFVPLGLF